MEHRLRGVEFRDWRQHTSGITSQKNDIGWMFVGHAGNLGVADVLDGISTAGILGQCGVIVIDLSSVLVEDNVLKNGTKLDRIENVGLLFC